MQQTSNGRELFIFLIFVAFLAIISDYYIYSHDLNGPPIRSDGVGYYAYLPSIFIYHDISLLSFLKDKQYALTLCDGKQINKYPLGTAILEAPFFFIADRLAILTRGQRDGYSLYYQITQPLAGIFYLILGLIFTYKMLVLFFPKNIALLTLPLLTFGTGLFHYATYDSSFSHVFSFCLIAIFLYYVLHPNKHALIPSILLGLIFLVRMPNAIVGIFLLWREINSARANGIPLLRWLTMLFVFLLIASLQFVYYYLATGYFIIWSYGGEGFTNWMRPEIINVLFSTQKGLFIYYPVLLFSMIGLLFLRRDLSYKIIIFLVVSTYITASWWCWYYGGSFGMRPFVDVLAVFSMPLAMTLDKFYTKKVMWLLIGISIAFTMFTTLLYWWRMIAW
ncbi:hypothetical protein [Methanothrix soehngenii]|uniref:hypothetical protein n=1 Tax=Methanothrix soehngenii TaxID=2223 RepID=UPI0023541F1D|nr:hypothetical protein [Methanothrix soehngenii]